jgi:hypothetical protein
MVLSGLMSYFLVHTMDVKSNEAVYDQIQPIREKNGNYKFINPLLAYDLPESKDFGEYADLSKKLNDLVDSEKAQGKADDISVYFRGNQGRWVGINDSDGYYPASLLKVVVMIAYFQQAQTNPDVLNAQVKYTSQIQNEVTSSEFNIPSSLKLNNLYKVDDLIRDMIVDSDNGATFTLINSLDGKALDEVYTDFGLKGPGDSDNYEISAKDYSLFFRILFNATYLNRQYSEKALSLLSQSTFTSGLVSGLPRGTIVAHKFGEHVLNDGSGNQTGIELHDCGIIYGKPQFLLCVMTRGQKVEDLEQTIKDITSLVYKEDK